MVYISPIWMFIQIKPNKNALLNTLRELYGEHSLLEVHMDSFEEQCQLHSAFNITKQRLGM